MLALTDAQLARLVIAASAVPRNERREWLERLAEALEPDVAHRRRNNGAARRRRHRTREKMGHIMLSVETDEHAFVLALARTGRVSLTEVPSRPDLAAAAGEIIRSFTASVLEETERMPWDAVRYSHRDA